MTHDYKCSVSMLWLHINMPCIDSIYPKDIGKILITIFLFQEFWYIFCRQFPSWSFTTMSYGWPTKWNFTSKFHLLLPSAIILPGWLNRHDNDGWPRGAFQNAYELLNLRSLKISTLYGNHNFQCMGKIFCVEFQRYPLKLHTKYLTHTPKDVCFIQRWIY